MHRLTRAIQCFLPAYCLLIGCLAVLGADCRLTDFHIAQAYGNLLCVSVAPRDLTVRTLTCLARTLKRQREADKGFVVLFFSSREAAERFLPPVEGHSPGWSKQLRALYSFDPDKPEESLMITPMGYVMSPSLVTTLDLSSTAVPHCQLELQGRCVMEATANITYPQAALNARASGMITVTGTIKRDGGISDARVAHADVNPGQEERDLADAALLDLRAWRFDAGEHDDPIRITYSYSIDTSLPHGGAAMVRWSPPDQVRIRANTPE